MPQLAPPPPPPTAAAVSIIADRPVHGRLMLEDSVGQRNFLTPFELTDTLCSIGATKASYPLVTSACQVFIGFGGILSSMVAGGIAETTRKDYPVLPKVAMGATFPIALMLIIILGADLFTGNAMLCFMARATRRISLKAMLKNWTVVYFANLAGCLVCVYFFGYLSNIYDNEPYLSFIRSIAVSKNHLPFGVVFLKAIAANWLVCLGVCFGVAARDIVSKVFGIWFMVFTFVCIGYEHCIANMVFIPAGLMMGAETTVGEYIYASMIPTTLGNILGGAVFVGLPLVYFHARRPSAPASEDKHSIMLIDKLEAEQAHDPDDDHARPDHV